MKLVGRIPVEPLDDERLTNIERRIVVGVVGDARGPARARAAPAARVRAPSRWRSWSRASSAGSCAATARRP